MDKGKIIALLKEIRNMAGEMTMTGMLRGNGTSRGGDSMLTKTFNKCLAAANENGFIEDLALFEPLDEKASAGEVGVAAGLLASYIGTISA